MRIARLQEMMDSVGGDASVAAKAVQQAEEEKNKLESMVQRYQRKLEQAEQAQRKAEKVAADGHASVHEMQRTITRLRTKQAPAPNVLVTSYGTKMGAAAAVVVQR